MKRHSYDGLRKPSTSCIIYNLINLSIINTFCTVQSLESVRFLLGYGPDDMLIVHMWNVCRKKAQCVTYQAF